MNYKHCFKFLIDLWTKIKKNMLLLVGTADQVSVGTVCCWTVCSYILPSCSEAFIPLQSILVLSVSICYFIFKISVCPAILLMSINNVAGQTDNRCKYRSVSTIYRNHIPDFLLFRLVTYVILFGLNVKPLFGKNIMLGSPPQSPLPGDKGTPKHKLRDSSLPRDIPFHNCSMSPEAVREEVETLKTDFNNRIKQVLFNSMLCAYYMGFVPLCFAQVSTKFTAYVHCSVWYCPEFMGFRFTLQ